MDAKKFVYTTIEFDYLCFCHAVLEAMYGHNVEPEIREEDYQDCVICEADAFLLNNQKDKLGRELGKRTND